VLPPRGLFAFFAGALIGNEWFASTRLPVKHRQINYLVVFGSNLARNCARFCATSMMASPMPREYRVMNCREADDEARSWLEPVWLC
jgi:hypothetical protein